MKAKKLAAAALACGMAWALMVGGTMAMEDSPAETIEAVCAESVAEGVGDALRQEAEDAEDLIEKALEEQEAKRTEEEARAKAEEEARAKAEAEAAAAAARQQAESAASYEAPSYEPAYYEPEPYCEPEPAHAPEPAYTEETPAPEPEPAYTPVQTIVVGGVEISYIYSYDWVPDYGAGVWRGSDSTTDGSWGYFVGHNPGSFWPAASIGIGGEIVVNDGNGDSRTYHVVDAFVVPVGSTWSDVSGAVCSYGESVALQTCVDGGYRIVVAA